MDWYGDSLKDDKVVIAAWPREIDEEETELSNQSNYLEDVGNCFDKSIGKHLWPLLTDNLLAQRIKCQIHTR